MFINKIQMIIMEIISIIVMVVKRIDFVFDFGKGGYIMLIGILVISVLVTLSESERKDC